MYNIIIQEALPEMRSETGEIVNQPQAEYTLSMIFPGIYTHYIKGKNEVMNMKNVQEMIELLKVIVDGEGDIAKVKEILRSDTLDWEHVVSGNLLDVGVKRLIAFANDNTDK